MGASDTHSGDSVAGTFLEHLLDAPGKACGLQHTEQNEHDSSRLLAEH